MDLASTRNSLFSRDDLLRCDGPRMNASTLTILVVDDSEDDRFLFRRAVRKVGGTQCVAELEDGQAAMDYLAGRGEFADRATFPIPEVMFLDLKMPGMSGFDVLEWVRNNPAQRPKTIVVFTSSNEEVDRKRCALLGTDRYEVKGPLTGIIAMLQAIVADHGSKQVPGLSSSL